MNNNYYSEFESIHGELVEMMENAIENFIYDIDVVGIDLLNSNLSLEFSTIHNMTGEKVYNQDIEYLYPEIDITTATPLAQRYAPEDMMSRGESDAFAKQITKMFENE